MRSLYPAAVRHECRSTPLQLVLMWKQGSRLAQGIKKARRALNGILVTHLRDFTCHMGSHSHRVTCYPTQVNAPRHNPNPQAGTRFTHPGRMEG